MDREGQHLPTQANKINIMSFSIYTCAFKLEENDFDWEDAIDNFTAFADEVVVAILSGDTVTRDLIKSKNRKVRVVDTPYTLEDPLAVGKLKNAALQNCFGQRQIGLDMDERIPLGQKTVWENLATNTIDRGGIDSILLPTIDLWGDVKTIKNDFKQYNGKFKWYLHRYGLKRGVVNFAKIGVDQIDNTKSDTCELLDQAGDLTHAAQVWDASIKDIPTYLDFLKKSGLYVFHLGYANLERRHKLNNEFWEGYKLKRCKGLEKSGVITDMEELEVETVEHGLPLWDE